MLPQAFELLTALEHNHVSASLIVGSREHHMRDECRLAAVEGERGLADGAPVADERIEWRERAPGDRREAGISAFLH